MDASPGPAGSADFALDASTYPSSIDIVAFIEDEEERPRYLIDKLLPAESFILISGEPKRGHKSWFALRLALGLASGKGIGAEYPCEKPGRVLIIEEEGTRTDLADRLVALCTGMGVDYAALKDRVWIRWKLNCRIDSPALQRDLAAEVRARKIDCVVIDPLADCMIGDENKVADINPVKAGVKAITRLGCSVILIHHVTKPTTDYKTGKTHRRKPDQAIRGSTAIAGAYDLHYAIESPEDMPSGQVLVETQARAAGGERFHFLWDFQSARGDGGSERIERATLAIRDQLAPVVSPVIDLDFS